MKTHALIAMLAMLLFNACTINDKPHQSGQNNHYDDHKKETPVRAIAAHYKNVVLLNSKPIGNVITTPTYSKVEPSWNYDPAHRHEASSRNDGVRSQSYKLNQAPSSDLKPIAVQTALFDQNEPQNSNKGTDGLFYLIAALMALTTLGLFRLKRKNVTAITRWAKTNPKKAQGLIAILQFLLIALAFYSGHNLKELGYTLSEIPTYIIGALTGIGFLSVPFLVKNNSFAIPKIINRQRLGYLSIILSSLMLATIIGNNFVDKYAPSPISNAIVSIDNTIFPSNNSYNVDFPKLAVDQDSTKKKRKAATGISLALAIFLIFLLTIVVCSGICLVGFGIWAISTGNLQGIIAVIVGSFIVWLGVKGINRVLRKRKIK